MTFFQALLGFLTALPGIIKLISSFVVYINRVSGNDVPGFISRANVAFKLLNEAKTQEEKMNAAKELANLISSIRQ